MALMRGHRKKAARLGEDAQEPGRVGTEGLSELRACCAGLAPRKWPPRPGLPCTWELPSPLLQAASSPRHPRLKRHLGLDEATAQVLSPWDKIGDNIFIFSPNFTY